MNQTIEKHLLAPFVIINTPTLVCNCVPTLELSPLVTESPTVEPLPELTAREELHEERSKKEVTIDDQTVTLDMNIINEYKAVYSHGGMYTFICIVAFL